LSRKDAKKIITKSQKDIFGDNAPWITK
jgi:hypothetical protein